jgi:hypothetical protein
MATTGSGSISRTLRSAVDRDAAELERVEFGFERLEGPIVHRAADPDEGRRKAANHGDVHGMLLGQAS